MSFSYKESTILLLQSLVNESEIDKYISNELYNNRDHKFAFKPIKTIPLLEKFGYIFKLALFASILLIPLINIIKSLWFMLVSAFAKNEVVNSSNYFYISFFERHVDLIRKVMCDEDLKVSACTRSTMAKELSIQIHAKGFCSLVRLYGLILMQQKYSRMNLLLHSYNVFDLLLLHLYLQSRGDRVLVISDIFQRWAYIAGWSGQDVWMIQHGTVRQGIVFPYKYNDVSKIFAYSSDQFLAYKQYYTAQQFKKIETSIELKNVDREKMGILLASSSPYLEQDIKVAQLVKLSLDFPLYVKFHPRHNYNSGKQKLVELADHVVPSNVDLACLLLISHSSSYSIHYQRMNIPTIDYSEYDISDELLKEIKNHLLGSINS